MTGDELEELVRASEQAARDAGPGRGRAAAGRADRLRRLRGTRRRRRPPSTVFAEVAPALGRGLRRAAGRAAAAVRLRRPRAGDPLPRHVDRRPRLRHDQPTGRVDLNGKSPDYSRSAWVGRSTRDFTDVDLAALDAELDQAARLGRAVGRAAPGAVRDAAAAHRGRRPADLPLRVGRRPGTPPRAGRSSPRPAAARGSASGSPSTPVTLRSDPAEPGLESAPFVMAHGSFGGRRRSSTTACPIRPDGVDPVRRAGRADPHPARRRRLTGAAAGAAGGQPGPGGAGRHRRLQEMVSRHRARPAADLPLVHPRGRPADAAADRADPGRGLPGRGRRGRRRGEQLPVQRVAGRPAGPARRGRAAPSDACRGSGATASPGPRCRRCGSRTSTCRTVSQAS